MYVCRGGGVDTQEIGMMETGSDRLSSCIGKPQPISMSLEHLEEKRTTKCQLSIKGSTRCPQKEI